MVLSPTAAVELVVGGTDIITAIPKDAGGNSLTNREIAWASSDPTKVTVAAGVVTGVALGTATITATIEGHSASTDVTVKDGAVVSPSGATFSAQASVVTVTVPSGALTATRNITVTPAANPPPNTRLMPGTAFDFGPSGLMFAQPVTITIKYDPTRLTAGSPESGLQLYEGVVGTGWRVVAGSTVNTTDHTVTGTVSHFTVYGVLMQPTVETISINSDATTQVHTTIQFSATLKDNEQQPLTRPVTWTSSDKSIATIDANGLMSALLPGQTTITGTSEGKSATAKVTVVPGPPTTLAIAGGDAQLAVAGSPVPVLPAIKVSDAFGNGVSGFSITFAVASGGGTLTGGTATTNASGVATVGSWTLGTNAGANTLTATGVGLTPGSVTFIATGGAGAPTAVAGFAGNNQTGTAGGPVATPPSVKVTDANGNPVAGFTVVFAPGAASGTVSGGTAVTNASGIAAVLNWILGTTPGAQTLVATAGTLSGSPITFNATAVAPVPSRIVYNDGDGQTARVSTAVNITPSVKVVDPAGIGVPGVAVTFSITSGGGSVPGSDAVTNVNGFASPTSWILGASPGANTLTATAGSLQGSPVTFNATGVANPPVAMQIFAGNQQTVAANTPVPIPPQVLVTDAGGHGVSGVSVAFTIRSGSGTITGANAVTNGSGIATLGSWTAGVGGNSLFASSPGLANSPLIFVATGTVAVQVVTFGDSNTDFGFSGANPTALFSSYVSNAPSNGTRVRLGPDDPNRSVQLAGKIESRWRTARPDKTIRVVNHGISGTFTGAGRDAIFGTPNALEAVNGVTRFQGEVLGFAYPWSGGEPTNDVYPNGPVLRIQAFQPRNSDFAYMLLGTNDVRNGFSTTTILANLETMVDQWIALGRPANHFIIVTLPPCDKPACSVVPSLNDQIRSRFGAKGARVLSLDSFVSNNRGLTWNSTCTFDGVSTACHVGDSLHFSEVVRDWLADNVVSIMNQVTP